MISLFFKLYLMHKLNININKDKNRVQEIGTIITKKTITIKKIGIKVMINRKTIREKKIIKKAQIKINKNKRIKKRNKI
jgi:hypothetical protein